MGVYGLKHYPYGTGQIDPTKTRFSLYLGIFDRRPPTNILVILYIEKRLYAKIQSNCFLYTKVVEFQNFRNLTLRVYGSVTLSMFFDLKMTSEKSVNPIRKFLEKNFFELDPYSGKRGQNTTLRANFRIRTSYLDGKGVKSASKGYLLYTGSLWEAYVTLWEPMQLYGQSIKLTSREPTMINAIIISKIKTRFQALHSRFGFLIQCPYGKSL